MECPALNNGQSFWKTDVCDAITHLKGIGSNALDCRRDMAFITAFYQTVGLCVDNGVAVLTRVIAGIAALYTQQHVLSTVQSFLTNVFY